MLSALVRFYVVLVKPATFLETFGESNSSVYHKCKDLNKDLALTSEFETKNLHMQPCRARLFLAAVVHTSSIRAGFVFRAGNPKANEFQFHYVRPYHTP
jgi:hypothetical protein